MTEVNQEAQLAEIEISLEQAKEVVAMGLALQRLYSNQDFIKVIGDGYFKDEALRLVYLKGDSVLDAEAMKDVDNQITAIGLLRTYFRRLMGQAQQAQQAIQDMQDMQHEMLNGEDV
jgi:rRNA processing protein Krr1/Pno1